jgi:ABC-type branched-subunit amino acid transport system ATPase component
MTTRLVKRLDELAQGVPPPRDLWPAISAAIEADRAEGATAAPRAPRAVWRPAAAMAAAVALVTVGVYIGKAMSPAANVTTAATTTAAAMLPAAFERDANYRKQRDELMAEAQKRLQSMPPEQRTKVSASLNTLRRSITEIEAALGRDPANALLQELLVSSCQEEMRALTAVREAGGQET